MKFDPSKPVETMDGRPARIVCTDYKNGAYPIIALISDTRGEVMHSFTINGRYSVDESQRSNSDLINVKEKRYAWINIYKYGCSIYDTKLEADDWAAHPRLGCMKVEVREEFDD